MRLTPGDVVWVDLDPTVGHEQAKHRPAVVISDERFASSRSMFYAVPLTSTERNWPFRVRTSFNDSLAMPDQVRSISTERITRHTGQRITEDELARIRQIMCRLAGA
jgi:mRNA interferase MazF